MVILGVDPGTSRTGWGVIDFKTSPRFIDGGILKVNSQNNNKKLFEIHQSFSKILKKYQPKIVGIEKIYFVKNLKTGIEVAQARGVLMFTLIQKKISFLEFSPSEIKMGICHHGRADKKSIIQMVQQTLNVKLAYPDDVYDALAIALVTGFHIHFYQKLGS